MIETIANMGLIFKLKDRFDNGQDTDYIFDYGNMTIVFDKFDYICPDADKGFNFIFSRGGHMVVCLTINLSTKEYLFLGDSIIDEIERERENTFLREVY